MAKEIKIISLEDQIIFLQKEIKWLENFQDKELWNDTNFNEQFEVKKAIVESLNKLKTDQAK